MEQDGHSSQQPFPQFDIVQLVDGLEDLLGSDDSTTRPAPTATQATISAKQPENSAPALTAVSVTDSPQANTSATVAHGKIEPEIL